MQDLTVDKNEIVVLVSKVPVRNCAKFCVIFWIRHFLAEGRRRLKCVNPHHVLEVDQHHSVSNPGIGEDAFDSVVLRVRGKT